MSMGMSRSLAASNDRQRAASNEQRAAIRRLSVNVAGDVAEAIDEIGARHQWTITEVIRRAVSVLKFVEDETVLGGRVLVEVDGKLREVRFL